MLIVPIPIARFLRIVSSLPPSASSRIHQNTDHRSQQSSNKSSRCHQHTSSASQRANICDHNTFTLPSRASHRSAPSRNQQSDHTPERTARTRTASTRKRRSTRRAGRMTEPRDRKMLRSILVLRSQDMRKIRREKELRYVYLKPDSG